MNAYATAHLAADRGASQPAARAAGLAVVTLATVTLLWLVTSHEQHGWSRATIPLTVAGEHYRVDPAVLSWLSDFSTGHFAAAQGATRDEVIAELDVRLQQVFATAVDRIPAFADWYYSLGGEYSRLAMAALAFANLAESGYVAAQAAQMLLPEEQWADDLLALQQAAAQALATRQSELHHSWLTALTARLAPYRVPAPAEGDPAMPAQALALDPLLASLLVREADALQTRVSLSTLTAGGVAAGPALWRAAGARNPAVAGRAAARSAGRGAARAGSAATTGTTLCAPAGVAAIGCGLVAGAAAWLATDWLLLRLDEHINRDELEQALKEGLEQLHADMRTELVAGYDLLLDRHFDQIQTELRSGFIPARAGIPAAIGQAPAQSR